MYQSMHVHLFTHKHSAALERIERSTKIVLRLKSDGLLVTDEQRIIISLIIALSKKQSNQPMATSHKNDGGVRMLQCA